MPATLIGGHKAGLKPTTPRCIAELATLVAFLIVQSVVRDQPVLLNHILGFSVVFFGVFIVLVFPWTLTVGRSSESAKGMAWSRATTIRACCHQGKPTSDIL